MSALDFSGPIRLIPTVKNYDWGKEGAGSLIGRLMGIGDAARPLAELWLGSHRSGPAKFEVGGRKLEWDELIELGAKEVLGVSLLSTYGRQLPFLLKVISVGRPLSIQAHPDKAAAASLHAERPELYPDSNHKPEIAVALTQAKILMGVRPQSELEALSGSGEAFGGFISEAGSVSARQLFDAICKSDDQGRCRVAEAIREEIGALGFRNENERVFMHLLDLFGPRDPGVLLSLLLNVCELAPGQALHVKPGTLHAYLSGDMLECMANSDNVARAGLTTKPLDFEALRRFANFDAHAPELVVPQESGGAAMKKVYDAGAKEFQLVEWSGEGEIELPPGRPFVGICLRGEIEFSGENTAAAGACFIVPAEAGKRKMQLRRAQLFCATASV
ncbi:MAG: mannose-6-phosphate isomerase, class I [Proteobacteria bacterium]|nr:MAG: mannose-6-phosphate isomerase, class I [Pseudomonadota bacterium]